MVAERVDKTFVEKINLNLKENEMGVTFISLEDSNSLLINKDKLRILVVLKYNKGKGLKSVLDMFGATDLDYILMNKYYDINISAKNIMVNERLSFNNINFEISKNFIKLNYLNHNFCIYNKTYPSIIKKGCQYIYILDVYKKVNIKNDNINMIFYNEESNSELLEPLFDKWIDIYMIKNNYYVTLKLDEDSYDIITLPQYK